MNPSRKRAPRRGGAPKQLSRIVAEAEPLQRLKVQGEETRAIKAVLWPYLPPTARQHCDLAIFRDSTLFLVADSPMWAARLRHLSRQILHAARQRCKIPVRRIKVSVAPKSVARSTVRRPRRLSEGVRSHLSQVLESVSDPELASVLRRLSAKE